VIDSHRLTQHVTSPTHQQGHTLDVILTRSDCPVTDVRVEYRHCLIMHTLRSVLIYSSAVVSAQVLSADVSGVASITMSSATTRPAQ